MPETTMTDTAQRTDDQWERCDFRRPSKLGREQVRSLDLFHDTFARRLKREHRCRRPSQRDGRDRSVSQLTWDEYVRTLPAFTFLATASVRPLQGDALIEVDTPLALGMANRLLGGAGGSSRLGARRNSRCRRCGASASPPSRRWVTRSRSSFP
ncbi:MAG: hypothetical protein R2705_12825 [Ilumatobacteraceae bacterium]